MGGAGWFFNPKAELIAAQYSLDHKYLQGNDDSLRRTDPVFSADTRLIFERNL